MSDVKVALAHLSGSKIGRREEFEAESVLIGRGAPNDVMLDPFLDPTVSAQHAEIRLEPDGFVLYDMGSLNGTFLNGQFVRRASLQTGDEISLGKRGPRLRFSGDANGFRPNGTHGRRGIAVQPSGRTVQEPVVGGITTAPTTEVDKRSMAWIAWIVAAAGAAFAIWLALR
jgi:pSer/pThr/pTyr-binding forkhead associated (FHA) protein